MGKCIDMALVDHNRKFIFIHIFKCAGNSIRKVITDPNNSEEVGGGHANARDVRELMGKEFDDYYTFTVVRNPFDWLFSTYYYVLYSGQNRHKENVSLLDSFEDFPRHYVEEMMAEQMPLGANKCTMLKDFVCDEDGNQIVDFIGKKETLQKDINTILTKIEMPSIPMPRINVNVNKAGKNYKDYYPPKLVDYVTKTFADDLQYFDYGF